ncbi:hypothetical protein V8E54_003870 [Elaphomyces granulatus]
MSAWVWVIRDWYLCDPNGKTRMWAEVLVFCFSFCGITSSRYVDTNKDQFSIEWKSAIRSLETIDTTHCNSLETNLLEALPFRLR